MENDFEKKDGKTNEDFEIDSILKEIEEDKKPVIQPDELTAAKDEPTTGNEEPLSEKKDKNIFVIQDDNGEVVHKKPEKKKKKQRSGCLTSFIWVAIVGIIAVALGLAVIYTFSDIAGLGKNRKVEVNIPQKATANQIADILQDKGAIKNAFLFKIYLKMNKPEKPFQYGVYIIESKLGYEGIIAKLQDEGEKADEVKITIKEGDDIDKIAAKLEAAGVTTKAQFLKAMTDGKYDFTIIKDIPKEKVAYLFEGYLFPDTYRFYKGSSEKSGEYAINKMLEEMDKKITPDMYTKAQSMGYSMHQILTMASIIEEEASGNPEAMKNISAIFYNRLNWTDQPKLLGSTPTTLYKHGSGRYDTTKNEGLPPGPLCSPSIEAVKAALNPTSNFFKYYFVTDKNKKFYYASTLSEHNQIIANLKRQKLWEY